MVISSVTTWAHLLGWLGDPMIPIVRLPLGILIPMCIAISGLAAEMMIECIRAGFPSGASWSERKHFNIVVALWIVLAAIQTPWMIASRHYYM
jgi:hypothetical protein